MKALTWQGKRDVRVAEVPDPRIEEPTDAVVRITSTAICGSDLHLYEVVARAIVDCADRPRREVSVGHANIVMRVGFTVLPGLYDLLVGPLMRIAGLGDRTVEPHDGTVFTPDPGSERVRGGRLKE